MRSRHLRSRQERGFMQSARDFYLNMINNGLASSKEATEREEAEARAHEDKR
jgi:hypothetical protein